MPELPRVLIGTRFSFYLTHVTPFSSGSRRQVSLNDLPIRLGHAFIRDSKPLKPPSCPKFLHSSSACVSPVTCFSVFCFPHFPPFRWGLVAKWPSPSYPIRHENAFIWDWAPLTPPSCPKFLESSSARVSPSISLTSLPFRQGRVAKCPLTTYLSDMGTHPFGIPSLSNHPHVRNSFTLHRHTSLP